MYVWHVRMKDIEGTDGWDNWTTGIALADKGKQVATDPNDVVYLMGAANVSEYRLVLHDSLYT